MDAIYQQANESKLNFNVPKGQPLLKVWDSLWQQCESANERLEGHKTCFPKSNAKSMSNIMKMLTVFQNEVKALKEDSRSSVDRASSEDVCESCGLSKSKLKLLEDNYKRRGKMIEYLLSMASSPSNMAKGKQPSNEPDVYNEKLDNEETLGSKGNSKVLQSTTFVQPRLYPQERETHSTENPTSTLVHLLPNFSKYDPNKDPFSNMSLFEDTCSQHNLGPRESCLMMKLWLPSTMSVRLASPISRPAGGLGFWSGDDHWGDRQDRLKALAFLVTGEDDFGIDILEDLKVTPQDDPWEFSRKFEQAYRLVMGVKDVSLPPAMLKALVNKFTFLDCATRITASKERTVDGIVKIVDKYRRSPHVKQTTMIMNQFSPTLHEARMAKDENPVRLQSQPPQDAEGNAWSDQQSPSIQGFYYERPKCNQPVNNRREAFSFQVNPAGDFNTSEDSSMFPGKIVEQNKKI
ncbi:uncharacterized protein LOC143768645 [Ranitomeya variabilis]|uniref:uncharacterized protein LOC143768645 n=1 Tax=Ranitomeya variabilis TaxID=490064 RepID=UPI0040561109